ncbi:MAG TPA: glycosyltransferase family 2 protein [Microbacteriaceae bacterium]|nr:glycosyltransferase family 2 protein [Microbacteriaceae bacterium]
MKATIAILTFNGEHYLRDILDAIFQQRETDFEVLVIDSGSTDRTLDILRAEPRVRVHQIPNHEFGHGRTRNLAAQLASGEFVVYLTHDAVPASPDWLGGMLEPFELSPRVVAVMGKQIPRTNCFPLQKYDIEAVFRGFGPDFSVALSQLTDGAESRGELNALSFYSDVNSATRRDFLLNTIPYRDVPYSEDQLFGRDVITAGYIKAYAPRGAVIHSNDLRLREFGKRIFDETVGLRRIGTPIAPLSTRAQLKLTIGGALRDEVRILRDRAWSWKRKLMWLVLNPLFHIEKWRWYRRASRVALDDAAAIEKASLEHSRKESGA